VAELGLDFTHGAVVTPPSLDDGSSRASNDVMRALGRIEGQLQSFTDLVKTMQVDYNGFDSRLATLELANAARTEFLTRLVKVESTAESVVQLALGKRLNDIETSLVALQQFMWKAGGALTVVLLVLQWLIPAIVAKLT
jgi:uncharacterized UPF0160 family protein